MLARGFIEVKVIGFTQKQYISIEHITRIKWSVTGGSNIQCGELWLATGLGTENSGRIKTAETPPELMILINKERELIRAMEKAANG